MPYATASALHGINNKAVPYRDLKINTYLSYFIYIFEILTIWYIYEILPIANRIIYTEMILSWVGLWTQLMIGGFWDTSHFSLEDW